MGEVLAGRVPAVDPATDRADPQAPGLAQMQGGRPVDRQRRRVCGIVTEMCELAGFAIQPAEAFTGGDPQITVGAFHDGIDAVCDDRCRIGRVVTKIPDFAGVGIVVVKPAGVGAHPDAAVGGLVNGTDVDVAYRIDITPFGQKRLGLVAVVAEQAFARSHPQESFAVEHDRRHDMGLETLRSPNRGKCTGLRGLPSQKHEERDGKAEYVPDYQDFQTSLSSIAHLPGRRHHARFGRCPIVQPAGLNKEPVGASGNTFVFALRKAEVYRNLRLWG